MFVLNVLLTVLTPFLQLAEGAHEVHNQLPFPPFVFGIIAFVALTALAIVTWGFRDVANRHAEKADRYASEHQGSKH